MTEWARELRSFLTEMVHRLVSGLESLEDPIGLLVALLTFVGLGVAWLLFQHGSGDASAAERARALERAEEGRTRPAGEPWVPLAIGSAETPIMNMRIRLEGEGIDVFMDPDETRVAGHHGLLRHRLYVPRSRYEEARRVLKGTPYERFLTRAPEDVVG